jgi:hypothetical protein
VTSGDTAWVRDLPVEVASTERLISVSEGHPFGATSGATTCLQVTTWGSLSLRLSGAVIEEAVTRDRDSVTITPAGGMVAESQW